MNNPDALWHIGANKTKQGETVIFSGPERRSRNVVAVFRNPTDAARVVKLMNAAKKRKAAAKSKEQIDGTT